MRVYTELMDKIFSNSTPDDFKAGISTAVEQALTEGSATFSYDGNTYVFSEANGNVAIEDKKHGEVTMAKVGNSDIKLEGVAPKSDSPTLKSVQERKPSGEDKPVETPGSTEPSAKSDDAKTVTDADKAGVGKNFSDEATLTFSEDEVETVIYSAQEAEALYERLQGTGDVEKAFSLYELSEQIKAYSQLAQAQGYDMSDIYEACSVYSDFADDVMDQYYSDLDINEFFSELDGDEVNEYFSGLDEVESQVLYSCLMDQEDTYTFSEVDDIINEVYSDLELEQPVSEVFSEMNEDEVNEFFSNLSDSESQVILDAIDNDLTFSEVNEQLDVINTPATEVFSEMTEDEADAIFSNMNDSEVNLVLAGIESDATFSEINEGLATLNTPLDEVFSDMTEDEANEFFSDFEDNAVDIVFSMLEDEEANFTYSDFLDVYEAVNTFSDNDLEVVQNNAEALKGAVDDMKQSKDEELAKKVKVLADANCEECEKAEGTEFESPAEAVKEECKKYSEEAAKVLDEKGVNPEDIDKQKIMEEIEQIKQEVAQAQDKAGHAEATAQEAKAAVEAPSDAPKGVESPKSAPEEKPTGDTTDATKPAPAKEVPEEKPTEKTYSTYFGYVEPNDSTTISNSNKEENRIFSEGAGLHESINPCLFTPIN